MTVMLKAVSRSTPNSLRQHVVIAGHHVLVTDEPEHLGGTDTGPAPHELLAAAVASCVSTTLVMYAQRRGIDLGGVEVDVDYDHKGDPRRCDVSIRLGKSFTPEELAKLEKVAATCPVRRALESTISFDEHIENHRPGAPAATRSPAG